MKIRGKVLKIGDLDVFSSGRRKQSIVLATFEKKIREFEIHFYDENIYQLESLSTSDRVWIKFDLQSEVFEDKNGSKSYFTHIIGLEILERKGFH